MPFFPLPPHPLSLAVTEGEAAPNFLADWPVTQRGTPGTDTLLLLLQITKSHNRVTFSS